MSDELSSLADYFWFVFTYEIFLVECQTTAGRYPFPYRKCKPSIVGVNKIYRRPTDRRRHRESYI